MKRYAAFAVAVSLWGIAAVSSAGTIASPAIPTGPYNNAGACYIRNAGSDPVLLTVAMTRGDGTAIPANFDGCSGNALAAGVTCVVLVYDLPDNVSFACSATADGKTKELRGTVELREISPLLRVIAAADLR